MNPYPFPEVFDSSMLGTLKSCEQLFYKTYIMEYKSKRLKVDLHAGASFAKGLEKVREAFYVEDHSAEDSIALGAKALLQAYGTFDPGDSPKTLDRMLGALEFYFQHYPLNHTAAYPIILPGGKRAIEFSFVHPLAIDHPVTGQPILFSGRFDAIQQAYGGVYGFDEKTTKSLGPTWPDQWKLRGQYVGYKWGAAESGVPIKGMVTRGVSILKTKYETAESMDDYADWEVARWYTQTLGWIARAIEKWKSGEWFYNLDQSCSSYGGCGFVKICKSEDEKPWLDTYFERRHWNPVTREETLL